MLDLDVNHFLRDLAEDVRVERVRQDVESGISSAVSTTPTFFIIAIALAKRINAARRL
jgi:predicted DsbA family dithiol-disulfide isomerase